jgi:hypothetical protein
MTQRSQVQILSPLVSESAADKVKHQSGALHVSPRPISVRWRQNLSDTKAVPARGFSANRDLDAPVGTVSPSSPTVLAAGRVTRNDSLTVELHQPPDSPAFILLRWPQAASVVEPNPRGLAGVASLVCGSSPKHKASWPPSGHPNYDRSGTVPTCPLGRPLGLGRLAVHPRHRVVAARLSSFPQRWKLCPCPLRPAVATPKVGGKT